MDRYRVQAVGGGARIRTDRRGAVKWLMENAVTVAQFEQLIADRRIEHCIAFQQADGWFVVMTKVRGEPDLRHLATFRELGKARRFSRLDVLFRLVHNTLGYNRIIQVLPYTGAGVAERLKEL